MKLQVSRSLWTKCPGNSAPLISGASGVRTGKGISNETVMTARRSPQLMKMSRPETVRKPIAVNTLAEFAGLFSEEKNI